MNEEYYRLAAKVSERDICDGFWGGLGLGICG